MRKIFSVLLILIVHHYSYAQAQPKRTIQVVVMDDQKNVLAGSTVYLLDRDSVIISTAAADASGGLMFTNLTVGKYRVRATRTGFEDGYSTWIDLENDTSSSQTITLRSKSELMKDVTIVGKKQPIQFLPDKTVIHPEASIGTAGSSVMEVLERSPGITVGKDGSIIMKGKPAVTVLIDGKPTQLSGSDLQSYLSGINASQVDVIELIENPGAKYDASGNAGIINIKLKSNRQKGFNGSMSLSLGQGNYSKTNNSLNLNYRNGKVNLFLNYGMRLSREEMNMHTLRKYFNSKYEDSALLKQPNVNRSLINAHNMKVGLDFFASNKTTFGLAFTGGVFNRNARTFAAIDWMDPQYNIDSSINTWGTNNTYFKRGGVNLNGRHKIDERSEISADLDYVRFDIKGNQNFQTQLAVPGSEILATKGTIPSALEIVTLKADYSKRFSQYTFETGLKTAINKTDNLANYYSFHNNRWEPDLSRSNHFLYNERISAVYASVDAEKNKWHWQAGLRYEVTSYKAHQLGNAVVKDSAFKRNYGSLFPTAFVSYQADSNNTFTFRIGRRIDRPVFQTLNPFVITLNKYTYETGNPFIKPQYTWTVELLHTYKQMLTTQLSYSYLRDYFSQIFILDDDPGNVNKNIMLYTRGNVGSFKNYGISETFQSPVTKWWNITASAIFNHKIIKGFVWAPLEARISQLNVSLNNQFQFGKGWAAEIGGYYQTRSQIDLQEWLTPQGELNLGVSKQILNNKGTLRLTVRDITYFQNYSGYSTFENAYEPFDIKWDTRVVRLNFSWRFGKAMKAVKRSEGGAADEINRVQSN